MDHLTKEYTCKKCGKTGLVRLVRNITASGVSQVYWLCRFCNDNADGGGHYIPHKKLKEYGVVIDDLKVINDYRDLEHACIVCGALGAELHHFAPRFLFGDRADKWPTGYLCNYHHLEWHGLVTPDMNKRKNRRDKI